MSQDGAQTHHGLELGDLFYMEKSSVRKFAIVLSLLCSTSQVFADGTIYNVFDMKKSVPLHDHEKGYRDYYVNMGSDQGVKVGSIIAIYRRVGVIDKMRNELHEDMIVPVAHLRVIQATQTVSVARLASIVGNKDVPVVDVHAVALGDRAELVVETANK